MTDVLFVDDEISVLAGIRRMFHGMRGEWKMRFAHSGQDALDMLAQRPADVVVSDMTMPGMDGTVFLRELRNSHPSTVRIILSGHAELKRTIRSVPVAHQFLSKPCPSTVLKASIQRSLELQKRLSSDELRQLVGSIDALPSPSNTMIALNDCLEHGEPAIGDVIDLVRGDVAIGARLLQLANSAFFGLSHEVTDVTTAVNYLGLSTVRDLVAAVDVFRSLSTQNGDIGQFVAGLEAHSVEIARLASSLMPDSDGVQDAYSAGLLHDIGLLILATHRPQELFQLEDGAARQSPSEKLKAESSLLGATHAELGAYLLSMWGLPYGLVEAVARHHDADTLPDRSMSPIHAVFIAEKLTESGYAAHDDWSEIFQDSYLEDLGIKQRVIELTDV